MVAVLEVRCRLKLAKLNDCYPIRLSIQHILDNLKVSVYGQILPDLISQLSDIGVAMQELYPFNDDIKRSVPAPYNTI